MVYEEIPWIWGGGGGGSWRDWSPASIFRTRHRTEPLFWQITSREGKEWRRKGKKLGRWKLGPSSSSLVWEKGRRGGASPLLLLFSFILSPFFFFALSVFPPLPLLPLLSLPIHLPTSHSRISPPGKKTTGWRGILGKTIILPCVGNEHRLFKYFPPRPPFCKKCSCACEKKNNAICHAYFSSILFPTLNANFPFFPPAPLLQLAPNFSLPLPPPSLLNYGKGGGGGGITRPTRAPSSSSFFFFFFSSQPAPCAGCGTLASVCSDESVALCYVCSSMFHSDVRSEESASMWSDKCDSDGGLTNNLCLKQTRDEGERGNHI